MLFTCSTPNIPRYTGCTLYNEGRIAWPMHSREPEPVPQTTMRVHCRMPLDTTHRLNQKPSQLARMVTTVPPSNPFNRCVL